MNFHVNACLLHEVKLLKHCLVEIVVVVVQDTDAYAGSSDGPGVFCEADMQNYLIVL